ncbi:MAG: ATP-binding cassette domain-containing protein, partial [Pirellulales bacterium]|nr:ATP-binding cassette domain-containing protein [Pirellulales bacterium]
MPAADIVIKGAREHNLRNIDLTLPRNQLICLTGVSGSGKSSLAFDTLYAEGQRRYIESLSTFARQFLGQMPKPDVDFLGGLSPSISISQKTTGRNPRSTVGTITEIYDYLRVLFARIGQGHCPKCHRPITAQTREQIIARVMALPAKTRFSVLAPIIRQQKGEFRDLFEDLLRQGFVRARVDGDVVRLAAAPSLDRQMRHHIEVVIDRLVAGPDVRNRVAEAVEAALAVGQGNLIVAIDSNPALEDSSQRTEGNLEPGTGRRASKSGPGMPKIPGTSLRKGTRRTRSGLLPGDIALSSDYACTQCGLSFVPPTPQLFSFNSPQGMCLECDGLGEYYSFDPELLVTEPDKSFKQGCIELLGKWKDLGRWKRHIYAGVAETMERKLGLAEGVLLDTPWIDLPPQHRDILLWGTGDEHITFTWRAGKSGHRYGGTYPGIIPDLLSKYHSSKSKPQIARFEKYMRQVLCSDCNGQRLNPQARSVTITTTSAHFSRIHNQTSPTQRIALVGIPQNHASGDLDVSHAMVELTLPELCSLAISDAVEFFRELLLDETQALIAAEALKEIRGRLGFLTNVGLDYLTLDRTAPTLSGGEAQRIRLAGQIGCGLVGVLYILDEPSIGLHARDNRRLLRSLEQLRDQGNTVVVVEHDEETMRTADHLIDFGPGPGVRGGEVVATGSATEIAKKRNSITGAFLAGKRKIRIPETRRLPDTTGPSPISTHPNASIADQKIPQNQSCSKPCLIVHGAAHNNLKGIDVAIPLGAFVCVTGVSGSGKSSLVNDILIEALRRDLNGGKGNPGKHAQITGLEHLDKMISIDQSPIGRTPRSNPGTYIKLLDDIRRLYAELPEARRRGYKPGRFSFNVRGGRCEACEGNGSNRLEMDFLADVWVTCPLCEGHRFNRETLQVRYRGKSISDVLEMDVQEALDHFQNIPVIAHKLQTLHDVGLDYLKLGQPSPTLSGGEAQRIKLARELVKKSTGRTLYILDEPTTGLHFADIEMLLRVLHDFVDAGNTVLVVEHNLDVVKTADWIIDIGPEGGAGGGEIVVAGTPEDVVRIAMAHEEMDATNRSKLSCHSKTESPCGNRTANLISYTGRALAPVLAAAKNGRPKNGRAVKEALANHGRSKRSQAKETKHITVRGATEHNLRHVNVQIARDAMTVCCGPSGSGKSSLAMDTVYAEGQRRYVESLSAYARQFVGQMQKPAIEHIEGLSPAIAIEQRHMGHTPRSTVGTVTEIYDYFRILFARLGQPYCPDCDLPVGTQTADEITDKIVAEPEGSKLYLMAPVEVEVGEFYETLWDEVRTSGYVRVRIDGTTYHLDDVPGMDRRRRYAVEVVVDRIAVRPNIRSRIAESIEAALALGHGVLHVAYVDESVDETRWEVRRHSLHRVCEKCGRSFEALTPHHFSFNSALGWCPACHGLGTQTGANPAALLRDGKMTLAEGAIAAWPRRIEPQGPANSGRESRNRAPACNTMAGLELFHGMRTALSRETGIPLDVPYEKLTTKQRRTILHGTGDLWIQVRTTDCIPAFHNAKVDPPGNRPEESRPLFRFQYKGLYPALEEAARLSPALRTRLEHLVDEVDCGECGGSRLRDDASAVRFRQWTIDQISRLSLGDLLTEVTRWKLNPRERKIAGELIREIKNRLSFLVDVGLEYLTIGRSAPTLSGGESQRIRLASQVGSGLCGVLYVLDEPTIGLHPRDNIRLIQALRKLRDLGNTLLVVEHDREVVASADQLLDFGPGAGYLGGSIVAEGSPRQITKNRNSVTGPYLSGKKAIPIPTSRRIAYPPIDKPTTELNGPGKSRKSGKTQESSVCLRSDSPRHAIPPHHPTIEIIGARHHNLKNINVSIPLGTLTVVAGVSGSGKSSLIDDVLYNQLARTLHRARTQPGSHDALRGLEQINKVVRVDQHPIGNTPKSNPATYSGVFDLIRQLFAQLPEAKLRGYPPRRFSFNVPGGRCDDCEGAGQKCIEMHFLPDVWIECETCKGHRYNPETLAVRYRGRSIADVLDMSCGEALELFKNIPKIRRIVQTLCDVGLDYVTLGQSAPTLSGGEAQRVKLAAELARPDTGQTLYLLDEPTTGLHFIDLAKLLDVLHRLVDLGNTVVVIEHNLDVLKNADWIIEIGPEAGDRGGYVVTSGTPEAIVAGNRAASELAAPPSPTATALAPILAAGPYLSRKIYNPAADAARRKNDFDIQDLGREVKMPWEVDGRRWHTQDRIGRDGSECKWDGQLLDRVERRIHKLGDFSPTNWNSRTIVEITAKKKTDGWFFHAITGETHLLRMKFRMMKNTFRRDQIIADLALKPWNELHEVPIYGREPRVKCKSLRGPWQEVQIDAHSWNELNTPTFWSFLERAVKGFIQFTNRAHQNPEDVMPWKVLGQKWHLSRKGFAPGKPPLWDVDVLEELIELLAEIAPGGQFLWNNKASVRLMIQEQREPWATVWTKFHVGIELQLYGPCSRFPLGRIRKLGAEREVHAEKSD